MKNDTIGSDARVLREDEIDCINGGVLDNCTRLPGLPDLIMPPTGPGFVDPFASKLPSWVRHFPA
jgi:hypothetical protein